MAPDVFDAIAVKELQVNIINGEFSVNEGYIKRYFTNRNDCRFLMVPFSSGEAFFVMDNNGVEQSAFSITPNGLFRTINVTTTEKNALTPTTGVMVFDTTLAKLCIYTGSAWETITSA